MDASDQGSLTRIKMIGYYESISLDMNHSNLAIDFARIKH